MDIIPAPSPALSCAPRNPRRDGWTADRQALFIAALGDTASVTQAAARAGMTPQSAHWLRRQPAATAFRAAWDAALAQAWQQVEASALERVINGETDSWDRDGVRITRHRPCSARLVIHMLERALAAREKAEAAALAKSRIIEPERVARLRAEIRALATNEPIPDAGNPDRYKRPPPEPDAATKTVQRLHDLARDLADWPGEDDATERAENGAGADSTAMLTAAATAASDNTGPASSNSAADMTAGSNAPFPVHVSAADADADADGDGGENRPKQENKENNPGEAPRHDPVDNGRRDRINGGVFTRIDAGSFRRPQTPVARVVSPHPGHIVRVKRPPDGQG